MFLLELVYLFLLRIPFYDIKRSGVCEFAKPESLSMTNKLKPALSRSLILVTIIAGFLLVIANSALWVNRTLFNDEVFTTITKQSLLSESSRNALAEEIVDTVLENRPLVKNIAGDTITKLISGLLNSSQAESGLKIVISSVHLAITSENPKNIEYDLVGIKNLIDRIVTVVGDEPDTSSINKIPDKIVILDVSKLPKLYVYGTIFLWVAPIALIGAVILLARPHIIRRRLDAKILTFQGFAIIGASVTALLVGPLFRPPLLAQIPDSDLRVVVDNVYNAFIENFNTQTMWLFGLGLIILSMAICSFVYYRYVAKLINKS